MIASLLEIIDKHANTASVYGAFLKKLKSSAQKTFDFTPAKLLINDQDHIVYNMDANKLIKQITPDILYLDPPYNERQYASNYHLLETIAKYDNPQIHGKTGMREYSTQKSRFCNPKTALEDLNEIAKIANYKFLVLSYNSEGIMDSEKIIETLSKYGTVKLEQFEYARFKSNNNGLAKTKKTVYEQLYILKKGDC